MITGQQVRTAQVSPYGSALQTSSITDMLTAIMPLIMIMMVMMSVGKH